VYHPDKTTEKNSEVAKSKFQAISLAYQVLKNPDKRAEYNESGHVDEEDDDDEDDTMRGATKNWKDYFDLIFGKLTTSKIDQFALKYKCSEEEQNDVLKHYKQFKGDLNKMLEFVMLSEPVDAKRWLEDYIQPAIDKGTVPDYKDMIQKSLQKVQKKIEKEQQKKQNNKSASNKKKCRNPASDEDEDEEDAEEEDAEEMTDDDATETESEGEAVSSPPPKKKNGKTNTLPAKQSNATKAKPTKAKVNKKKAKSKEDDLVAMIQAKHSKRSGDAFFAGMAAKYGAQMDDDPLGDDEFEKIQSRLNKKKKRTR
jgi:DnaJ homolog subfamily C member 9